VLTGKDDLIRLWTLLCVTKGGKTMIAASARKLELTADGFADVWEAAEYLSMSRSSIYKLMESGELQYAKFGKARRIPWRALREYAERCMIGQGLHCDNK
jgi:excisionase family DNA binding protein